MNERSGSGGGPQGPVAHAQEGERLTYTMPEAASALGISERYLWKLAQQGILPLVRLGGRTLVRKAALERALLEREGRATPSAPNMRVMK